MRISNLEIDIGKGTLRLTGEQGGTATYRRDTAPASPNGTHITFDPITGWRFLPPLLNAQAFPQELFVKHPSPGQPRHGPFPAAGAWAGVFRYVLDKTE
jgi:hypothetical protein